MNESLTSELRYLQRPDGRVAYTVTGDGPLVVAVPGMGDLRGTYRDLVPSLVEAGYRVAVTDVRGHGDSDTSFRAHGDDATGADLLALIDELGGPAVVVGNSMGASSAAWAAAERPDAVAGLVLLSPFLRERPMSGALTGLLRAFYSALLRRPWGASAWGSYYAGPLNKGAKPAWLAEHVNDIRSSLRRPEYLRSFRELAGQLDHSVVEARLDELRAPALIVIGEFDPDYPDPAAELAWAGERIGAETVLVPDAAHYPHAQHPELVVPSTLAFLGRLREGSGWGASRA